jgi:DNA-nicking Smr family endonuclease
MARSKFNRKNSTGSVQPLQRKSSAGAAPSQGLVGSTSPQETLEAIDYHFDHLNTNLKSFLLSDPNTLNLKKFVDFWASPENIDSTSPNLAASICGCSWYLGLNYLSIGMLAEARALTLNGCFLQQCYNTPIEEIKALCSESASSVFRTSLPYFNDGLLSISNQTRLVAFLKSKVTTDYQRRMAFATRTTKSKSQVKDYINQIGSDWNETPGGSKAKAFRKRASTGMNVGGDDKYIDIILVDAHTKKETSMRHGTSMPLKLLVKKFAEDQDLPLKKLRFSYKGKNLFLSTLGQKSSQDLGISHLDSIFVHIKDTSDDEVTASSSSDESSKENDHSSPAVVSPCLKKFKPFSRKNSHTPCAYVLQEEQDRRHHSRKLSLLFEEAEPRFKEIRQKLADLSIECQPKAKSRPQRVMPSLVKPIDNPCTVGQGGKAGVPFYVVHVGETDNLYKTRHVSAFGNKTNLSIDLHGYTREQALQELDTKLPEWVNTAQRGQYPFVIPVTIICGCGSQILSEAVDEWIKSNDNVANAPKKKFSRRVSY